MAHITGFYAALGALLVLGLVYGVVERRRALRIGLGDGGDEAMARRIRAHGNAIETLPLGLLLLLLLELGGTSPWLLHLFGALLLLGRGLHAWGIWRRSGVSFGRFWGMGLTLLATAGMAIALLLGPVLR
jgi:uncharacterized protein